MDQNFQTSFIPKKPIVKENETVSRPVGFLLVISLFILFTVLLATGGLYFYKRVVANNIVALQDNLNKAINRFEPAAITRLQVLSKRLDASTEILSKHITVVPIFDALEALTLKTIRYTKFSYTLGTEKNTLVINVQMSGIAKGYMDIALQADLFTNKEIGKKLIDPVFSNLTLDNNGNVLFDLNFSVDSDFVNYKHAISAKS